MKTQVTGLLQDVAPAYCGVNEFVLNLALIIGHELELLACIEIGNVYWH